MKKADFPAFIAAVEREILASGARFYIWGAGVAGKYLYKHLSSEPLRILGFLDTDPKKRAASFCGLPVAAPETVEWTADTKIILASLDYPEGMEQYLKGLGKEENRDYFFSNTFLTVYFMSRHGRLYLHHLNVNITDRCTLRCRDCSLCVPYYSERRPYPIEEVLAGLERFFSMVDYVQELHLIGGEPLLYPELVNLTSEVGRRYRGQIGEFAIATNGGMVPDHELCEVCKKYDVFFTISDYRGSPGFTGRAQIPEILDCMKRFGIPYRIGDKAVWFDFSGGVPEGGYPEEALEERFHRCFFRNRGLYLNRLYFCQHQYGTVRAGFGEDDPEGCLDLSQGGGELKKLLFAFELGALPRGYLKQCANCAGFERLNTYFIDAAVQCTKDTKYEKMG